MTFFRKTASIPLLLASTGLDGGSTRSVHALSSSSVVGTKIAGARALGGTDLVVSEACLGTMTWGMQNTQPEAFAQMDYALNECGVNFLDAAELYPYVSVCLCVCTCAEEYTLLRPSISLCPHKNTIACVLLHI